MSDSTNYIADQIEDYLIDKGYSHKLKGWWNTTLLDDTIHLRIVGEAEDGEPTIQRFTIEVKEAT